RAAENDLLAIAGSDGHLTIALVLVGLGIVLGTRASVVVGLQLHLVDEAVGVVGGHIQGVGLQLSAADSGPGGGLHGDDLIGVVGDGVVLVDVLLGLTVVVAPGDAGGQVDEVLRHGAVVAHHHSVGHIAVAVVQAEDVGLIGMTKLTDCSSGNDASVLDAG